MADRIWVYAEVVDGAVTPTTLELLTKAADGNDMIGLAYLGYTYAKGIGVAKDLARGTEFFKRAARLGEHGCQELLRRSNIQW